MVVDSPKSQQAAPPWEAQQLVALGAELAGISTRLRADLDAVVERHHRQVTDVVTQCRLQIDLITMSTLEPLSPKSQDSPYKKTVSINQAQLGSSQPKSARSNRSGGTGVTPRTQARKRWMPALDIKTFSEDERMKEQMSRKRTWRKSAENRASMEANADESDGISYFYEEPKPSLQESVREIVTGRKFELFFCGLILTNAIFFGIEAEYLALSRSEESPLAFKIISLVFTAFFTVELALRWYASGCTQFFRAAESSWNIFDFTIVALSLLEVVLFIFQQMKNSSFQKAENLTYIRMLRIVRTARIFRVIRIISFFRSLRLLLLSVLNTLRSLFWTLLLLTIILYTFGVIFTQAATQSLAEDASAIPGLDKYFGSVSKSVYTLFKCITGGVDWENVVDPLSGLNPLWVAFFIVYIAFTYFAVLNVVTGVFCQTAIESAAKDQEEVMQSMQQSKQVYIQQLTDLFVDVDEDGSGELTIDEFEALLKDERLQKYCASLDITIDDAWALFKLLDTDSSGAIGVNEFVTGCLRLRGAARSVDVALLTYQVQWMISNFTRYVDYSDGQLRDLRTTVDLSEKVNSQPVDDTQDTLMTKISTEYLVNKTKSIKESPAGLPSPCLTMSQQEGAPGQGETGGNGDCTNRSVNLSAPGLPGADTPTNGKMETCEEKAMWDEQKWVNAR